MTTQTTRTSGAVARLALGDAAAIVLFVVVGLSNHREGITAIALARTALPLLGAWFAVVPFTRAYARPGTRTLLITWAIAVPIGVAIRAVALHRSADESQVAFAIVTLLVTLVFLLAARAIVGALSRRRRPDPKV